MRIKNLKTKDNLKELDVSFSSGENIIFVVEPYDETSDELPFEEERFLGLINCLFFNDSYTYAKNFLQNMLVECTLEKDDVDYTFGVIGSVAKRRENGCVHMRNLLNWYCNGPEKELQRENGGWWGRNYLTNRKNIFTLMPCKILQRIIKKRVQIRLLILLMEKN